MGAMMLRRLREGIGLLAILAGGCEVTEVDIEQTGTAFIPRDHTVGPVEMPEMENLDLVLAIIENPGVGGEDITEAVITSLRVEVLEPEAGDLAFAERVEVFAEAPGLERVRVAWQDEFPAGEPIVEFETDDVNLRDYVASRSVTIRAEISGDAPDELVEVEAVANLNVGVTLKGACNHMKKN
jgi:hypothetical protein